MTYHVRDGLPAGMPVIAFDAPEGVRVVYGRNVGEGSEARPTGPDDIARDMTLIVEDWRQRDQPHPLLRLVHRTAAAAVAPVTGLSVWAAHFAASTPGGLGT